MSRKQLDKFVRLLKASPSGAVFNPWWQIDRGKRHRPNCTNHPAPTITRLRARTPGTREARSHWRSSRLPRRSFQRNPDDFGAHAAPQTARHILAGIKPRRTSKPSVCPDGFSEPTATIVWGALLKIGVLPDEFVLWNAFPWHSFDPHRGLLSNRMPNKSEQLSGRPVLKDFPRIISLRANRRAGKNRRRAARATWC